MKKLINRRVNVLTATFIAASALNACTTSQTSPLAIPQSAPTIVDWKAAAIGDIEAAYAQTVAHHPGMIDPLNPSFARQLSSARGKGLAYASRATDAASYRVSMQAFSAAIGDGHAGVSVRIPNQLAPTPNWPGFITVWRGDKLLVYGSTIASISRGDEVISCDGIAINTLIERNVFEFVGRSKELGLWWVRARSVLVDNANPAITRPQSCMLQSGSSIATHKLQWQAVDKTYNDWRDASYNGDELPIGVSSPSANILWVAMPSFDPDEKGRAAYAYLAKQLPEKSKAARAVVLDLRHNQGGSSQWSLDVASSIWGKTAVQARKKLANAKVQIWWRATDENEKHITDLIALGKKENNTALVSFAITAATGFANARTQKQPFYITKNDPPDGRAMDATATDFNQPVYVIVPGQCGSACLDAIDVFSLFPNTKLIGAPSSADSTYMEIRTAALPSKMAQVILPLKIWVNRPRGNGAFYKPAIEVTDLDWSSAAFMKVIEKDLLAHGK